MRLPPAGERSRARIELQLQQWFGDVPDFVLTFDAEYASKVSTRPVKPNLSFVDATLTPAQAALLVSLWQNGAIAYATLFENLQRRDCRHGAGFRGGA
jgi:hypothetical protein